MVSHFTETYINIFILIIVSLFKTLYNFDYTDYLSLIKETKETSMLMLIIPRFILDFIKGKNTEILEDKQLEIEEPISIEFGTEIEQETFQKPINKIEQETLQKPISKIQQETLQKRTDLINTLSGGSQTIKLLSIIGGSYANMNNAVKEMKVKNNNNNNTFFSKINSKISSKIDSSIVDYIKFFNNINIKKGGSNLRGDATDLTDDINFMKEYLDKYCTDKKKTIIEIREVDEVQYQVEFSKFTKLDSYMCKKSSFIEDLKNIKNVSNNILNKKITEKSGIIILLEIILIFNIIVLDKKYLPKLLKIFNSKKLLFLITNEISLNAVAFTTLLYNTSFDVYSKVRDIVRDVNIEEILNYLEYIGLNVNGEEFLGREIQELSQLKETDWNNFKQKFNLEEHNVEDQSVDSISDNNIDKLEKDISNNKRLLQICIKVILHFYNLLQK